jgi:hypothetical protein
MKRLFFIILLTATVAHAEYYRWTDKEGTVHFSDSIGGVPAGYQKSIQTIGRDAIESPDKNKTVASDKILKSSNDNGSVTPDVDDLKERMMKDQQIMALMGAMQNDQELQVLLSDPTILHAIQVGDVSTLLNNPDFLKILNDPRVKEIEKRLNNSNTK